MVAATVRLATFMSFGLKGKIHRLMRATVDGRGHTKGGCQLYGNVLTYYGPTEVLLQDPFHVV